MSPHITMGIIRSGFVMLVLFSMNVIVYHKHKSRKRNRLPFQYIESSYSSNTFEDIEHYNDLAFYAVNAI